MDLGRLVRSAREGDRRARLDPDLVAGDLGDLPPERLLYRGTLEDALGANQSQARR